MTVTIPSCLTAILFQLGTNKARQLVTTTVDLSSEKKNRLDPLTVRQLAMTMSRITAILFQLGTIKVWQLAITTVVLSRVIILRLGTVTVTDHTRNAAILLSNGSYSGMI